MVKENQEQISSHGKKILVWEFWESEGQKKTVGWYAIIILIFLGLSLSALFFQNYLFLIFLILIFVILAIEWKSPAEKRKIEIFEEGVVVANKFYEWDDLETFWIIYQPPQIKKLYLNPKGTFNLEFSISLEDQDPRKVRNIFKEYVEEDLERKNETLFDSVRRGLKI